MCLSLQPANNSAACHPWLAMSHTAVSDVLQVEDMPDITWHPDIISFIADNPEQSLLFGTYAAHNAKCKCQRCLRETSQMGIVFSTMAK
jgi:hypothetical protein